MNAPLSSEENQILKEILNAAIGLGCMTEIALLNARQKDALQTLRMKGYVATTKKKYIVILPPDSSTGQ
jgi:hypothetical protein